jgi:two-component system NtrC family sensor kinase
VAETMQVLLVDDSVTNLEFLARYLEEFDYRLLFATSGERALEVAKASVPDLVLLDIMLPGIDGYETCRRLKNDPALQEIPVLFLSALDKVSDKVRGFDVGGVDYISKPVQKEELVARVRTHLELFRIRRENRAFAQEMEALAEKRAQALLHADRLSTLGTLSAGVAHEINNPTTFISVGVQALSKIWVEVDAALTAQIARSGSAIERLKFAQKTVPDIIANIRSGISRIQSVVSALKTYTHAGASHKKPCDVSQCITEALALCHNRLKYLTEVAYTASPAPLMVHADPQQIEQILVNLFINAADAMDGREIRTLSIKTNIEANTLSVFVEDTGPGIAPESLDRIWDPFYTTKEPDKGTGLGLSVSKGIVEEHGGRIKIENTGNGARFTVMLPLLITTRTDC